MRRFLTILSILVSFRPSQAQSVSATMGARSASMGNISSLLTDEWAVLNNIGGLVKVKDVHAAFSFEARAALPGSSRMAALISSPLKTAAIGLGVFKFGDSFYSEQLITAGLSSQLGLASLGLKINYLQYRAEGFGTKSALSVSVGGIAEITPHLSIAAVIQNVNQAKLTGGEQVPVRLATGLSFKPVEHLLLLIEVEKDLDYDPTFKGGLEYCIHKKVFFRTGFNLNPETAFFGIGVNSWRVKFDYSIQHNNSLNFAHQATAGYRIEKIQRKGNQKNQP